MASLKQFGKTMKIRGVQIEQNADALVRRVALAVESAIVLATPVDTGRARANWQVTVNEPARDTRPVLFEGSPEGNARKAIEEAKIQIAKYGTFDKSIFITNNLPYIARLNEGWSKQAPAGFVQKALVVGINAVRNSHPLSGPLSFKKFDIEDF